MASKSLQLGHAASSSILPALIKSQLLTKPRRSPPNIDLSGQVAIVTGASTGLGFQASHHLLSLGLSHLILAVRSAEKGEHAAKQLRSDYPEVRVDVWIIEMKSYSSILAFCQRAEAELSRLDIMILNAGIVKPTFGTCSTGHEEVIQVNYISTFLLLVLMLPISKKKAPAGTPGRITVVSSGTALWAKLVNKDDRPFLASFDDLKVHPWNSTDRYFDSKVLGHLFLTRLLSYVDANEVVVNLVEPGMCKGSDLHRDATGATAIFLDIWKGMLGRSLEDGAWTYIDAAVVKGKESHGCFLMDWEIHPFAKLVYTSEGQSIADVLWEETMAEFETAGVRDILDRLKCDGVNTTSKD